MFLIFGSITLLMWRGAVGVAEGTITGGTIAAFVITGGLVAGAFSSLSEVYGDLVRGAGAASRLAELLDERPLISAPAARSEEHTSELQSLMRISYAVFCLKKKKSEYIT